MRCFCAFLIVAATVLARQTPARDLEQNQETWDVVIRGGRIVDGTGNPWFQGDLAIKSDRIVAVGKLDPTTTARKIIDAKGLIVAPGFIDVHSHSDRVLLEDGNARSKIHQGVTTQVLGEDSSAGPAKGKRPVARFQHSGKMLTWATLGGYFDALEKQGIAPNVASYVGLGTLLQCVLGDSLARPDARQLQEMKTLLDEAMNDGAIGLSSMLAAPRELAVTTADLVELCSVVHRHGGLFSSHIRNEGTEVLTAIREAIAIGERSGVPVDVIHLKIADQSLWGRMPEIVRLFDEARKRGVNIQANVYPYTRGNNNLVSIIPPWAHEDGVNRLIERLKDRTLRPRLKTDIRSGLPGWYNHYTAIGGDWGKMLISARLSPANSRFQGWTMDRIIAARSAGLDPAPDPLDILFDFLIEESGSISTIYAHHTEKDMNLALAQPWCSIGSDGLALATEGPPRSGHPHPRSFGTFPRVLGVYVRDRGLLRLEDAVRKMTSLNAAKIGVVDRGLIRPGQFADITIFDPATVKDRSTYLEPFQYSQGIITVLVNGQTVLEKGKLTGARPGRALRHQSVGQDSDLAR
ncbi:MAG: N-acyl-D-amino-acid deacylase family protein [Isosphaeraceae bacterium]